MAQSLRTFEELCSRRKVEGVKLRLEWVDSQLSPLLDALTPAQFLHVQTMETVVEKMAG